MEALTKKQRREIYLKVATDMENQFVSEGTWNGLCYNLCKQMGIYTVKVMQVHFPEALLFKPDVPELDSLWWMDSEDDGYNTGCRIICMLLCAEMCND